MAERINTDFHDASTAGLRLTLKDSAGVLVPAGSISSISYTLSDMAGITINDLRDVEIAVANPVDIILSASDMTVSGNIQNTEGCSHCPGFMRIPYWEWDQSKPSNIF